MSQLKTLVISSSPRKDGNSDLLAKQALQGAHDSGAEAGYVRVFELNISPCRACGYCEKKGVCAIKDDFPPLMARMLESDLLIFATPIYFMSVSAWGKMVIDRCQTLWARKYVLNLPNRPKDKRDCAGICIAVGGSRSSKMFDSVRLTMKYFYDVLEIDKTDEIFYNRLDEKGAVKKHPEALDAAYRKTQFMLENLENPA